MALRFFGRPKRHVCVVGLDGIPHDLLVKLAADGVMPRTAELLRQGHLHKMRVTLPEISSVSWSSFMTGTDPGTHGIFGFTDLVPNSYRLTYPCYADLKAPTIWDRLGEVGKNSVVINQPNTYPARPLKGILVSGFVAPELRKSVFPPRYIRDLEMFDYQIDVDTLRGREDKAFLLQELDRALRGREKALDLFWDMLDWTYFELVVTGTDRMQHFLWDGVVDFTHPLHQACLDYLHKVDAFVGGIFDRHARKTGRAGESFYMLSDHGFCGIRQEVYLNAWLRQEGYLSFGQGEPESLEDLSEETRAFAMDPGRIYLHRRGRFPRGKVDEPRARALAQELAAKIRLLSYQGEPVVRQVFPAEEIYSGPHTARGPDLVVLSHRGFDLKASVKERRLFGRTPLVGMHTWDDAFFWSPEKVKDDLVITELAAVLLTDCGL